ncbi:unnamed protein product [Leptidea sinapis]|uniref:Autophagy-related protein 9 n=1 Tax=Leptidea sinapis TaxID=189913 RepID=A0A5E4PZR9_9NEOP|nr:unnamed protein product [Leptidea sinapis]
MDSRMTHFRRDINYRALQNEIVPPLVVSAGATNAAPTMISLDHDQDDTTNVIIHKVPQTKGGWSHIEDLDSFYTRMYRYYIRGGFYPMMMSDLFYLLQFIFIVWFSTFLVHCVDYPRLFRNDPNANRSEKLSLNDVILSTADCVACISWQWWCLIVLSAIILFMRLFISIYHLYHAYDIKSFYNSALRLHECDLAWVNWSTIQERVREAQTEHHMCVHKQEIDELDIYHRILRFNNYMVAMVNKNLLPLQIHVPCVGDFHYLSRGLKWNLEFLLFSSPWSPWENCWKLRPQYKDPSKRMILARQLEKQILLLAMVNLVLAPLVQAWQILYFFFNYAELIKRSPGSLGLRTWSLYARVTLRHFNELEHELRDRLNRAHKPATKYLSSFSSPITTVVANSCRAVRVRRRRADSGTRSHNHHGPGVRPSWSQRRGIVRTVLLSLRNRALDIVDFYRNFTVSVLGIGDVCSFAQLDIRRHGHPDWQTPLKYEKLKDGVVAGCILVPTPRLEPHRACTTTNKTMLGSYVQQSIFGVNTPLPADMDETSDEEEGPTQSVNRPVGLAGTSTALGASAFGMKPATDMPIDEVRDMSVSTLHLYDLHLSQTGPNVSSCCTNNCSDRDPRLNDEATPLLRP